MQHSHIGRCAVSTRDLMNNTHARLVCVLFRHWHFCHYILYDIDCSNPISRDRTMYGIWMAMISCHHLDCAYMDV